MADPIQTQLGFRIDPIGEPPRRAFRPEPEPEPEPEPDPAPGPAADSHPQPAAQIAGAQFPTPGRALAFVAALAGSGLADRVLCRRAPEGGWWVESTHQAAAMSHLVWTAGGRPYARPADAQPGVGPWQALDLDGCPCGHTLDADAWPQVGLAQILAGTGLRPGLPVGARTLYLAVPPSLGRWALKRALALDLAVGIRSARARPLDACADSGAPESPLLILCLRGGHREVPRSLARAFAALPSAVLAQSVGADQGRLLVDIAYRLPLGDTLLCGLIPEGDTWLLAGPETGHRALTMIGDELDAASLLEAPVLTAGADPDAEPGAGPGADRGADRGADQGPTGDPIPDLPAPMPVRLVPVAGRNEPVDALLLDDTELDWTRTLLMGRPLGERAFLVPGPGRHLLLVGPSGAAGGGSAADLPFGTPLTAAAPGGLLLECGLIFRPALPDGARRKALGLDPERVLVLAAAGAWRFDLGHLIPAWALWVGEPPPVQEGLAGRGPALLAALEREQRQREAARESAARRLLEALRGRLGGHLPGRELDPETVRAESIRAQSAGDLVRAAELRATVGDLGDAGRLYEQAAGQVD
jgi:hypothetical protein